MNNPILSTDFYTACSNTFAAESAKKLSVYNFTNRYSPTKTFGDVAQDSRMVFYGMSFFLQNFMQRITIDDVKEAELFMKRGNSFGGAIPFDKDLWMRVVTEYGGYLPINIWSVPDGTTFFPCEPVIHVGASKGFGELAAHIEARLVGAVSKATSVATLCFHWKERIKEAVAKDLKMVYGTVDQDKVNGIADFFIHNFGSRACATEGESILTGLAHLLAFNGTDNTDAAYQYWKLSGYPDTSTATSIIASAHRNCQAFNNDLDTVRAMAKVSNVISCVADCYNFKKCVRIIAQEAKDNPGITYIVRPDSGDAIECIMYIIKTAMEFGLYEEVNGCPIPKNMRFIYGDSVNPRTQQEITNYLSYRRIPATLWGIFGVGGYIVNSTTRDSLSSAYKLCETVNGSVVKLSEVVGKMSVPGRNAVIRPTPMVGPTVFSNDDVVGIDKVVYWGESCDPYIVTDTPEEARNTANKTWNELAEFAKQNPTYGVECSCLSPELIQIQKDTFAEHRNSN